MKYRTLDRRNIGGGEVLSTVIENVKTGEVYEEQEKPCYGGVRWRRTKVYKSLEAYDDDDRAGCLKWGPWR